MAIAFDASTQGTAGTSSTQTYSHTTSGSNRILYVHVYSTNMTDGTVSSVTYAGAAMTKVGFVSGSIWGGVYLWRLVNPAVGANNVVVTFSAGFVVSNATSYTGAKQSGGVFVSNTNQLNTVGDTSITVAVTPNSANNWIVCANGNQGANPMAATNSAFLRLQGSNIAIASLDTNAGVSGSTTLGFQVSGNGGQGMVAESFEPEGGASATFIPQLLTLGVG